jgi:hypothetical protein
VIDWTQFWEIVAVPVASGLLGWFKNAAEDGVFTRYELLKGAETIISLGVPGLAIWIVGNSVGIDVQAYAAATVPVLIYWLYRLFQTPQETALKAEMRATSRKATALKK